MKIQCSGNEQQLLADTLDRRTSELRYEIARTDDREFKQMLLQKLETLTCLQSQLIPGEVQLSAETGGALAEMLDQAEHALYFEIARTDNREFKHMLQKNLECLECVHSRLTEAHAAA